MRTSSPVASLLFTDEALIMISEEGALAEYEIEEMMKMIGVTPAGEGTKTNRRRSIAEVVNFTDKTFGGAVHLGDVAQTPNLSASRRIHRALTDSFLHPQTAPASRGSIGLDAKCVCYNEDYLYIAKHTAIFSCGLEDILSGQSFEVSGVSLMGYRKEYMADSQLQFLLDPGEAITDSHLIMAHAWPLYVVGTSRGRVFVVPLAAAHAIRCLDAGTTDAVSCLLYCHNMLISCSWSGTIQVWALTMKQLRGDEQEEEEEQEEDEEPRSARSFSSDSGQRIDPGLHLPLKIFRIPYTRLTSLKQVHFIREAVDSVPESEWKEKWAYWQRLLIGQLEDNTVVLLSMDERSVLCAFHGIRGGVKEALVHLLFDYLFLNCGDGDCYVFNMATQQLERIIPSHEIPYRAFRRSVPMPAMEETDESRSVPQQLLELNVQSLETHHSHALVWVEYPTLGGAQFPVLCLNVGDIIDSFREMSECPEQAEFIISLLYSWGKKKDEKELIFQGQIQELFRVAEPSVTANLGTFGLDNSISFRLPGESSRWEISTHISALLSTSLLSIFSACIHFRPSLKPLLNRKLETHVIRLRNRLKNFQRPSPLVLGFEAISGNEVGYELLKRTLDECTSDERAGMAREWGRIYISAIPDFDTETGKPIKRLSQSEALCVLSLCALSLSGVEIDLISDLVSTLGHMLRSSKPGYVLTAALLLHDGAKRWRPLITKELCVELAVWLIHLYHTAQVDIRSSAKKAILSIGKSDVPTVCEVFKHEVSHIGSDRDYPDSVLSLLECFVRKHARHILMSLPCVVEVILRSLDPREILLRKLCISKATDVLDVIVKMLPMVAFEPIRQLLAVGTSNNLITIYDLKTATVWKELTDHAGPVNVVSFSPSGDLMASYCITDSSLKWWKIDNSFLGFGSLQVNLDRSVDLPHVTATVKFTHELLHTIRVVWKEGNTMMLTREDGQAYPFSP